MNKLLDDNYTHNAPIEDTSEEEILWYNFFYIINEYLWLYGVPVLSVITIINNVAILVVAFCCSEFKKAIQKSMRIYYIVFAVTDLILLFAYHVTEWLSKLSSLITLHLFAQLR